MGDGEDSEFRFAPVTPATQADLERFSRAYGKFRWCSCLRWRLRSVQFRDAADRPGQLAGLVAAACDYARAEGAEIIEAYPWPGGASYRYMGTRELYADAGFTAVPGPEGARPVMRYPVPR